jgi:hypothetical protein
LRKVCPRGSETNPTAHPGTKRKEIRIIRDRCSCRGGTRLDGRRRAGEIPTDLARLWKTPEIVPAKELAWFPRHTILHRYWVPTIHAATSLDRKDPRRALQRLSSMGQIELGAVTSGVAPVVLCPAYLRGQAYLTLRDGKAAAAEFQKFIDHYGLVTNFPWGSLARLGVARAHALEAQTNPAYREKARTAYQNLLSLWKEDPNIPIYKQAQAQYAKLR